MTEGKPLGQEIQTLQACRSMIKNNDDLWRESELCYQMISLYMGIQEMLEGNFHAKTYMEEKAGTVLDCFMNLLQDKGVRIRT